MAKSQDAKKVQKKEPLKTAKEKKEETIQNEIKKTSPELEIIEDFFMLNF